MVGVGSLDERIGIVGAKLLYRSPKHGKMVQHGGMILGVHYASLIQFKTAEELGPLYANQVYRNCSAISGACLLTKNTLFRDIGGFDEENLAVDLSDVDYCLRAHERGYRTIWNPSAILIHDESATRGDNQGRGATLNQAEADYFVSKWEGFLKRDSYYRLS